MIATRIARSSATSAAMWAASLSPPSSTNSVTIGISANSELRNSESPTGSSTCLYTVSPPLSPLHRQLPHPACNIPRLARSTLRRDAGRALHHLLQRHAVPGHGPRRGRAAGAPRARGRLSRGADVLRADALQLGLRGRRAGARAAL